MSEEQKQALAKVSGEGMREMASMVSNYIDDKYVGFALIVFPVNDKTGMTNYISNCKREDMIKALRATADRIEKNMDIQTPNSN